MPKYEFADEPVPAAKGKYQFVDETGATPAMAVPPLDPLTGRTQMPGATMSDAESRKAGLMAGLAAVSVAAVPLGAAIGGSALAIEGLPALAAFARMGPAATALMQGLARVPGAAAGATAGSLASIVLGMLARDKDAPKTMGEVAGRVGKDVAITVPMEFAGPFGTAAVLGLRKGAISMLEKSSAGKALAALGEKATAQEAELGALRVKLASDTAKAAEVEFHNAVAEKAVAGIGPLKARPVGPVEARRVAAATNTAFEEANRAAYDAVKSVGGEVNVTGPVSEFVRTIKGTERGGSLISKLNQPTEGVMGLVKSGEVGLEETLRLAKGDIASFVVKRPAELARQPLSAVVDARSTLSQMAHDSARFTPDERDALTALKNGLDQVISSRMAQAGPEAAGLWRTTLNGTAARARIMETTMYDVLKKEGPESLGNFLLPNDPASAAQLRLMLVKTGKTDLIPQINRSFLDGMTKNAKGEVDLGGLAARLDDYGPTVSAWFKGQPERTTLDNLRRISQRVNSLESSTGVKSKFALDETKDAIAKGEAKLAQIMAGKEAEGADVVAGVASHALLGKLGGMVSGAGRETTAWALNVAKSPKNTADFLEAVRLFEAGDTRTATKLLYGAMGLYHVEKGSRFIKSH